MDKYDYIYSFFSNIDCIIKALIWTYYDHNCIDFINESARSIFKSKRFDSDSSVGKIMISLDNFKPNSCYDIFTINFLENDNSNNIKVTVNRIESSLIELKRRITIFNSGFECKIYYDSFLEEVSLKDINTKYNFDIISCRKHIFDNIIYPLILNTLEALNNNGLLKYFQLKYFVDNKNKIIYIKALTFREVFSYNNQKEIQDFNKF